MTTLPNTPKYNKVADTMSPRDTVYSQIIAKKIPVHVVYEDETTLAFLDHNPLTRGHCLVIPKEPVDHIDDCNEELYASIFETVQRVSKLLKTKLSPERVGLVVSGYEVPHAHVHVIPMYGGRDLQFPERPNTITSSTELSKVLDELVGI